ncbi:MAG: hypothetical protein JW867_08345, partial [Candidatus Omnitrophica bacterium]|nr:hypothetical protein [Candidatus Omnitrophota bacterium]
TLERLLVLMDSLALRGSTSGVQDSEILGKLENLLSLNDADMRFISEIISLSSDEKIIEYSQKIKEIQDDLSDYIGSIKRDFK